MSQPLIWMMYGDVRTQYPHSFPASQVGLSCLTISHTSHHAQINGHTWRSIISPPKRSCQCFTKTQLDVFNIPSLLPPATAAAAWLGHGNGLFALEGTQFPRHLRLQPKESMEGRSRFSRGTALKLNINDSREEEGMK